MVVVAPEGDALSPQAHVAFGHLRARFLQGLPARAAQIDDAAAPVAQRVQALHRLAGAAGSYGYDELGRLARQVLVIAEHGGPAPALRHALTQLREHIDTLVGGGAD